MLSKMYSINNIFLYVLTLHYVRENAHLRSIQMKVNKGFKSNGDVNLNS